LDWLQSLPDLRIDRITAEGGAVRHPVLQFQTDLLRVPIHRSSIADATALGAAFLAELHKDFREDIEEIRPLMREKGNLLSEDLPSPTQTTFEPRV